MEDQRCQAGGLVESLDAADEYGVVAGQVRGLVGYLETGAATVEERCAPGAGTPRQADEAVYRPGREAGSN